MPIAKITGAQIDFSAGELDDSVKRAHDSIQKIGARQMLNWRVLSSKAIQNRPGKSALFTLLGATAGRVEEFSMQGTVFFLAFTNTQVVVFSATGAALFSAGGLPWT